MRYALRSFWRNRRLTLCAALVVLLCTIFLLIFAQSMETYRQELTDSYSHLRATAQIRAAEADGTARLLSEHYQAILDSGFVTAHSAMVERRISSQQVLRGLDDPAIDPSLRDCLDAVEWRPGYDASIFSGTEAVCLVPDGQSAEDTLRLHIGKQQYAFTVAGVYGNARSNREGASVFYCPLETLRAIYKTEALNVTYCGLELELGQLERLDTFKAQMKALELDSGDTRLVIHDTQLQTITTQLRRQVRLLEALLPVLLVLIAAISGASAFLLLRGRRREAAVMRTLGKPRMGVFGIFLAEIALQALLGAVPGWCVGLLLTGGRILPLRYPAALLVCVLLGGGISAWRLSGINVFTAIAVRE